MQFKNLSNDVILIGYISINHRAMTWFAKKPKQSFQRWFKQSKNRLYCFEDSVSCLICVRSRILAFSSCSREVINVYKIKVCSNRNRNVPFPLTYASDMESLLCDHLRSINLNYTNIACLNFINPCILLFFLSSSWKSRQLSRCFLKKSMVFRGFSRDFGSKVSTIDILCVWRTFLPSKFDQFGRL